MSWLRTREAIEKEEAERLAAKMESGRFDLDDMSKQLDQIKKMGGMDGLMGLLPGVAKVKKQLSQSSLDESVLGRQQAIISSMTPAERRNPKLLNSSRKRRIAGGSGTSVQDVNRVLKQVKQMNIVMKRANKLGEKGLMRHGIPGLMPPR